MLLYDVANKENITLTFKTNVVTYDVYTSAQGFYSYPTVKPALQGEQFLKASPGGSVIHVQLMTKIVMEVYLVHLILIFKHVNFNINLKHKN